MLQYALSYLLGSCWILCCDTLPTHNLVYSLIFLFSIALGINFIIKKFFPDYSRQFGDLQRHYSPGTLIGSKIIKLAIVAALGFCWACYQARMHQTHILPFELEQKPIELIGYIDSFPHANNNQTNNNHVNYKQINDNHDNNNKVQFNFVVEQVASTTFVDTLNLGTIKLHWKNNPQLKLGQRWRVIVRLKRPRGFANPGSFDAEKFYFQQRITAIGYVDPKTSPQLISDQPVKLSHRLRQSLYQHINTAIAGTEFSGLILALTLGLSQAVTPEQKLVFQQTGIAHLLAISGLHIGFVAGLVFTLISWLWRWLPSRWLLMFPANWIAAWVAIAAAYGYALLAGFAVSTQRAVIMVMAAMLGILVKRKVTTSFGFAWALLLILILDPLVIMGAGFWLSFTAVGILLYTFTGRKVHTNSAARRSITSRIYGWFKPQVVIFIGMLPLSVIYFGNVVVAAPLVNFIVIPYVNILVIPLALLGVLVSVSFPLAAKFAWLQAGQFFSYIWPMLTWVKQLPLANWQVAPLAWWQLLLAAVGALWLLAPRGFPGRYFGLLALLPMLFGNNTAQIAAGEMQITVLDVGQGLSTVVRTNKHVLLYDAGPVLGANADAGELVIWPYLRSQNIKQVDLVIISHADLDHIGGLMSLTKHIMPEQILTPNPQEARFAQVLAAATNIDNAAPNLAACQAGQHWVWDGVLFEMMHPTLPLASKRNDQSCILKITTAVNQPRVTPHSILLTGDISSKIERQLVQQIPDKLAADVLLVPHHGSKSSSATEFVNLVAPAYALASVGYLNMYGHPKPEIISKYRDLGANFLDTAQAGAITINFYNDNNNEEKNNIILNSYRLDQHKFWRE